jgi:predicted TIM-barrel fold metal-dependent hydrolase
VGSRPHLREEAGRRGPAGEEALLLDTHVHVVDPSRFPLRPTGVGNRWWDAAGRDVSAFRGLMARHDVGAAVLVQPVGAYGYDNSCLVEALAQSGPALRGVAAVDLDDGSRSGADLAAEVHALAGRTGVCGIRLFAVAPGSAWAEGEEVASPRSAARTRVRAVLAAARDAGLVVVLTVFAPQLAALAAMLEEFPELVVAVDHCAFPELEGARLAPGSPLLAVRDLGHVVLKVSSHLLEAAAAAGDPADLVSELSELFGPGRLVWGSDYPQTGDDYAGLLALAGNGARHLAPEARRAFFGGRAADLFGFQPLPPTSGATSSEKAAI